MAGEKRRLRRQSPQIPWFWIFCGLAFLAAIGLALFLLPPAENSGQAKQTTSKVIVGSRSSADSPVLGFGGFGVELSQSDLPAVFAGQEQAQKEFVPEVGITNTLQVSSSEDGVGAFIPPTATSVPQATAPVAVEATPSSTLTPTIEITPTETLEPTPTETETPIPTLTIVPATRTPTVTPTPKNTPRPLPDRVKEALNQGIKEIVGQTQSSVDSVQNALERLPEAVVSAPIPTLTLEQSQLLMLREVKDAEKAEDWSRAEGKAYFFGRAVGSLSSKANEEYLGYVIYLEGRAKVYFGDKNYTASDPVRAWKYAHLAYTLSGGNQKSSLLVEIEDLLYKWHCQGKTIPSDILSKMGPFAGCR